MNLGPKALVSIICPVYNVELYISECIQSILQQSYQNFELIIIDDNSFDSTVSIVETFSDERIRVIRNEINLGPATSMNKGIELSNGEYIAVMHGDDKSNENRIQNQVNYLENNTQVDVLGSGYSEIDRDDKIISTKVIDSNNISDRLFFHNVLCHPTVMFRKKIFKEMKFSYSNGLRLNEDYDLWTKLIIHKIKISILSEPLIYYRIHNQQQSNLKSAEEFKSFLALRRELWIKTDRFDTDILDFLEYNSIESLFNYYTKSNIRNLIINNYLKNHLHKLIKENRDLRLNFFNYLTLLRLSNFSLFSLKIVFRIFRK